MTDPTRVQRQRTKGWRMPENTVYVGRGSKWGNPYKVGDWLTTFTHDTDLDGEASRVQVIPGITPAMAVALYRSLWLVVASAWDVDVPRAKFGEITTLRGKNLACWCALDQPCHADVLLELANGESDD